MDDSYEWLDGDEYSLAAFKERGGCVISEIEGQQCEGYRYFMQLERRAETLAAENAQLRNRIELLREYLNEFAHPPYCGDGMILSGSMCCCGLREARYLAANPRAEPAPAEQEER